MKKVTLAIALAALVLFAGCKKDKETTGTTLKASIEQQQGDGSKTSLDPSNGAIKWTAGDKILVNNGTTNGIFALVGNGGSTTGTFSYNGEYEFGESNVAVYPHTATISGNTVTFDLPAEQSLAAPGSFADDANPMVCTFSDPNSLSFTSLCGGLGLQLTGDNLAITAIEIVSNTTTDKLNGLFEADCTAANPVLTPATGNSGTNTIMLNCATILTDEAQGFYFVLPVGTLANGFTMNVYSGADVIYTKTTTSTALAVVLNMVKTMDTLNVTTTPYVPIFPEGAINGLFSISADEQVYFSIGNLQYNKTTTEWSFMEHQYDMVEYDLQNVGNDYANQNIVSLFGWGTSGYNHGAVCYQPWRTSLSNNNYYAYGDSQYNLYDQTGQADWGCNTITNGSNIVNWRTLTKPEFYYLLYERSTTSGIRWAKGKVNGVNGLILLPDAWTASIYSLDNTNNVTCGYDGNIISAEVWTSTFEVNGAVFLPAAGWREGATAHNDYTGQLAGQYWTSSKYDNNNACRVVFNSTLVSHIEQEYAYAGRYWGFSVRLVCDAE